MTEECRRIVADAEESDALTEEERPVETLLSHRSGEISEAFKDGCYLLHNYQPYSNTTIPKITF